MRRAAGKPKTGRAHKVTSSQARIPAKRKHASFDDEIDSGDSGDEEAAVHAAALADEREEEADTETAQERRVRLAREMLGAMDEAARRRSGDDGDVDQVTQSLEEDALRKAGRYRVEIAASLRGQSVSHEAIRVLRGPQLSPTCVALMPDETAAFCGCKDGTIVRWDLQSGHRVVIPSGRGREEATGHTRDVLSAAVSADGRVLMTGSRDKTLLFWDLRNFKVVKELKGHRGPVNALSVSRGDHSTGQLFSGAADRCAKVWDIEQRGYLETLYGHLEGITSLDSIVANQMLSAGVDRSVRLWKVDEEVQLLFQAHSAAVDCCALLHAEAFVSGSQDGCLGYWTTKRKKPLAMRSLAHGVAPWGGACWLSALTSPCFSDLAISGSCDGHLRFWHCDEMERSLSQVMSVPLVGFINGLAMAPSGKFVACAVGQEHRLGRWFRIREARNSLCIVPLPASVHRKPDLVRRVCNATNGVDRDEEGDSNDDASED